MDDSDLLYEDLFEDLEDGRAIIKTSVHEMEDRIKDLSNEADELRLQVRNLQEQNEGLSKQNEVLIRNISCLFKTAQMEISRKDKQIRSLQEESLNRSVSAQGSLTPRLAAGKQQAEAASLAFSDEQRRHGEKASKAESKNNEGETSLTASGAWKQVLHHQGCVGMMRSNGKGGDDTNDKRKRRRGDEESQEEYQRRRGNERCLVRARAGGGVAHRSASTTTHRSTSALHRLTSSGHKGIESNQVKRVCS